jgi:hypothetical protein
MLPAGSYRFWWLMTTGHDDVPRLTASTSVAGYVIIKPTIGGTGIQELEHRIVMEEWLCRKLSCSEDVHHVNGDKKDNRIENLIVCTRREHINKYHKRKSGRRPTDATRLKMSESQKKRYQREKQK